MKLQVGVKILIRNSEGQYLLIQRREPLPDGTGIKWDIPGGRIGTSEPLEEALNREVQEEIGIKLDSPVRLLKAQDIILPDIELHVVRLTYMSEFQHVVTLSSEHQNYKWVTQDEALVMDVDPYLHEVLGSLR